MTAETTFRAKAPWIMQKLLDDFPIGVEDAAAIVGNLGHESGGFASLQEIKPTVAGSRGGYGWAQWTGPRRREFEAYCARNGLDPASDQANYAWLFVELKGSEKRAIGAVVAADGLDAKVEAFEMAYERAGVKHYSSRKAWARRAMEAWTDASAADKVATIGHNGGPAMEDVTKPRPAPAPAQPAPSPVDQSIKSVEAAKGALQGGSVGGALVIIAAYLNWLPNGLTDVELLVLSTAVGTVVSSVVAAVKTYKAPKNAEPA